MNKYVKDYFREFSDGESPGGFHKVICLGSLDDSAFKKLKEEIKNVPKGWLELSRLPTADRINMLRDFWLTILPYCPHLLENLDRFFKNLDDVCIFTYQKKFEDPWFCEMVYSLKDDGGYFKGSPHATEQQLYDLQKSFPDTILPEDYMAFLKIHNGFSKATDTGLITVEAMQEKYIAFQNSLSETDPITTNSGQSVNPKSLIPFYESFGMPYYQCFWSDWYPESEMGTVYYSGITQKISNVNASDPGSDQMAFNTFTEWLLFYMETIA